MSVRVLVADDSVVFRRALAEALGSLPEVEVVGTVPHGRMAVQRVAELKPDILTLDLEMPEMDGLAVLDALRRTPHPPGVIVVSALSREGGALTVRALEKGAFDFITKPEADPVQSREALRRDLGPRIRALGQKMAVRHMLKGVPGAVAAPTTARIGIQVNAPTNGVGVGLGDGLTGRMQRLASAARPEMLLIGVSTGGPNALARLLPSLPARMGVPILIVQHMPPVFTQSLAEGLSAKCPFPVREAVQGEVIQNDVAYLAPGGRQMKLQVGPQNVRTIQITDDPPENHCRPSVDYLFRSVASQCPGRAMAVILTGMGSDGTLGLRLLKRHGCFVVAQDEASCVVFGMPRAAIEAGVVDVVLPLDAIGPRVVTALKGVPA